MTVLYIFLIRASWCQWQYKFSGRRQTVHLTKRIKRLDQFCFHFHIKITTSSFYNFTNGNQKFRRTIPSIKNALANSFAQKWIEFQNFNNIMNFVCIQVTALFIQSYRFVNIYGNHIGNQDGKKKLLMKCRSSLSVMFIA